MYIPILRKVMKNNEVFVERSLPTKGELVARIGDVVEPFTKLGMTKVSYGNLPLEKGLNISKGRDVGSYFYTGDVIGKLERKRVIAPFDGLLERLEDKSYIFKQEKRDFWLLSGVWGRVVDVSEQNSALIKTQTLDLQFAVNTNFSYSGELVVFPNPSELLEMQYLQKFSKDSFGKIIYVGDHINAALVAKAAELGVAGIFGGSVEREAMPLAKQKKMFLGAISGFGNIPTPEYVFDILKEISNRYVFLQGTKGLLRIPSSASFDPKEARSNAYSGQLRALKKGLMVQVFEDPYFGWVGKVHSIQDDEVRVIIDEGRDPVKVKIPNIISLE